jgi:hypothetical protein
MGFGSEVEEYTEFKSKSEKTIVASCNSEEDYLFIYGTVKSIKTLLVCEFDDDFVTALRKSVASYGVFSEKFKKFKV